MVLDRLFRKGDAAQGGGWFSSFGPEGVRISRDHGAFRLEGALLEGFLAQLKDDGLAYDDGNDILLPWDSLYLAIDQGGYAGLEEVLKLPAYNTGRPVLNHRGGLTDPDFAIYLSGWMDDQGAVKPVELNGPILQGYPDSSLMTAPQWALVREVVSFARRPEEQRTERVHRLSWARIRHLASAAEADMADFLWRTVVLSPDRLKFDLRKARIGESNVIEIAPLFEGAPDEWLLVFDRSNEVKERYDLPTDHGIVQVMISEAVGQVLREIKRMPGRRATGARAQAFIMNPYAVLGEGAKEAIDEAEFERARIDAGLGYERFTPLIERSVDGHPTRVGLLIERADLSGLTEGTERWLTDDELRSFIRQLEVALDKGFQLMGWEGYDLELLGDASAHLALLKAALADRSGSATTITYAQVHDLSNYSERIEDIGIEEPYYSPYIAKAKDEEGWFPANVVPLIAVNATKDGEPVTVPVSDEALTELREASARARLEGREEIDVPWLPKPLPIGEAEHLLRTFDKVLDEVGKSEFEPGVGTGAAPSKPVKRKTLIIRPNITDVDYEEVRREALLALPVDPEMPRSLRPGFALLPHQVRGLAWLQHLYGQRSEHNVRGALLADDMGLGKTFQLLAFMAWLAERDPNIGPMLVVAPVSLLENWKEEADKFITEGALPMLMAYGNTLSALRVPRAEVDERLRNEDGLVNFLRPGWVGNAKVVLTTYETLRDLEFSFATVKWSFMVCDEAQKIKNPAAMVTRAAKKQNAGFKIACTGTPVENTLADLWCLFDFIQPGLLGALNDFGNRYRRPIEAKTEEEKRRVEELRMRIAPQILRRTKADVATDLKSKVTDGSCRELKLSPVQRQLYAKAIEDFRRRNEPGALSPFKNHLGLLHYLRLICTDPRRYGLTAFIAEPLDQYRAKAPKLDWLIGQLQKIRRQDEKAIIFCEFREIQRLLQHYIHEAFQYRPDIINGDTAAAASHMASRQKRIKVFQERKGFGVLILSPTAVGFGVNIQAANHVIHYTRTWNPAKEDQATDRAYRIGQTKDVHVYYPVVKADDFSTFDVKLDQLLTAKRALAEDMLNGSGDLAPGDFKIADVVPPGSAEGVDEHVDLETALRMDWRYFEGLAAALWFKQGYTTTCYCTPAANDNGVDVVAIAGDRGVLVQTKSSSIVGTRLGWEVVKDLVAGEAFYQRKHPGVQFRRLGMTNQYWNDKAMEHAALNNVELVDQPALERLLKEHKVSMSDIERMLHLNCADGD